MAQYLVCGVGLLLTGLQVSVRVAVTQDAGFSETLAFDTQLVQCGMSGVRTHRLVTVEVTDSRYLAADQDSPRWTVKA